MGKSHQKTTDDDGEGYRHHYHTSAGAGYKGTRKRRNKAHHKHGNSQPGECHNRRPACIQHDGAPEDSRHIECDTPVDKLRHANAENGAACQIPVSQPVLSGNVVSPCPSVRCMMNVSSQRPCLKPTDLSVPVMLKPAARCKASEAVFSLFPTTATSWRKLRASAHMTALNNSFFSDPLALKVGSNIYRAL